MAKFFYIFLVFTLFINCKKKVDNTTILPKQIECDNQIDSLILTSKSKTELKSIFLDYKLGMSKKQFDDFSENYIKQNILKKKQR